MIVSTIKGLPDLKDDLAKIPGKLRVRALRLALAAGARVVRDEARRHTPVISASDPAVQRGHRKPGTVKNAIVVRTSKDARKEGNVGVFVNVRPAKGAVFRGGVQVRAKQRGAKSPNDPYYWRWLEFGRKGRAASAARQKVRGLKVGGVVVVRGVRARRALPAVGPMAPFGMLRKGAAKLQDALQVFITKMPAVIEKLNRPKAPPP